MRAKGLKVGDKVYCNKSISVWGHPYIKGKEYFVVLVREVDIWGGNPAWSTKGKEYLICSEDGPGCAYSFGNRFSEHFYSIKQMRKRKLQSLNKNMTKNEFLEYMKENHKGDYPLLRKLMSSQEIKFANELHKEGLLEKGKSDVKPHTIIFYYE